MYRVFCPDCLPEKHQGFVMDHRWWACPSNVAQCGPRHAPSIFVCWPAARSGPSKVQKTDRRSAWPITFQRFTAPPGPAHQLSNILARRGPAKPTTFAASRMRPGLYMGHPTVLVGRPLDFMGRPMRCPALKCAGVLLLLTLVFCFRFPSGFRGPAASGL